MVPAGLVVKASPKRSTWAWSCTRAQLDVSSSEIRMPPKLLCALGSSTHHGTSGCSYPRALQGEHKQVLRQGHRTEWNEVEHGPHPSTPPCGCLLERGAPRAAAHFDATDQTARVQTQYQPPAEWMKQETGAEVLSLPGFLVCCVFLCACHMLGRP